MKNLLIFLSLFFSVPIYAGANDTGTISSMYVSDIGQIAVKLNEGIPNITAAGECPGAVWVGHYSADPVMKSVLVAAKASGDVVTIHASGCEGNHWAKLRSVYVDNE